MLLKTGIAIMDLGLPERQQMNPQISRRALVLGAPLLTLGAIPGSQKLFGQAISAPADTPPVIEYVCPMDPDIRSNHMLAASDAVQPVLSASGDASDLAAIPAQGRRQHRGFQPAHSRRRIRHVTRRAQSFAIALSALRQTAQNRAIPRGAGISRQECRSASHFYFQTVKNEMSDGSRIAKSIAGGPSPWRKD
jgi:hypothetical protein